MSGTSHKPFFTVVYIVFALLASNSNAQRSVHFFSSSSPSVSSTEQASASVIVEQSEVASGRSISSGSFVNINQNDKPLKATGFGFKEKISVNGKTSPIPFVIPSYASGIIFRDSDNDKSPQVEIQPAINVLSKTLGPEETAKFPGSIDTTVTDFNQITPKSNVHSIDSVRQKSSSAQNVEQNIASFQPLTTTSAPSHVKTAHEPRFSDISKHVDILGLQAPGYAIRKDGTIDSDAVPQNFITIVNSAVDPLNPINSDASTTTTTTTTQRISRTSPQVEFKNPWLHPITQAPLSNLAPRFVPSADNPFLPRTSNQFSNTEKVAFASTTQQPFTAFTAFTGSNSFGNGAPVNSQAGQPAFLAGNDRISGSAFAPFHLSSPSAFSTSPTKNGHFIGQSSSKFAFNNGNNNFGNQLASRQSNNEVSNNVQQQREQKPQFVINGDNGVRSSTFGTTDIPTISPKTDATMKFASSFTTTSPTAVPTFRAPVGFTFSSIPTTALPTTTTNVPISTTFPSKFFTTIPPTNVPSFQSNGANSRTIQPSIDLLPPVDTKTPAKSAFAAINEAGALAKLNTQAKLNAHAVNNGNQATVTFRPFTTTPRSNTFSAVSATRGPIKFKTSVNQFPADFSTLFPTPTTKATTTTTTTTTTKMPTTIAPLFQFNKPTPDSWKPSFDLLPPADLNTQRRGSIVPLDNAIDNKPSAPGSSIDLPNNDLLPPLTADNQKPNSQLANTFSTTTTTTTTFRPFTTTKFVPITTTTPATTTTTERVPINLDLDLNPFLPPVPLASKSTEKPQTLVPKLDLSADLAPTISNQESTPAPASNSNSNFTTITLEQNPFLPQLDLDPFLPPFEFSIKATDAPPIQTASSSIDAKTANAPSRFGQPAQDAVFGNVAKSQFNANVATSVQKTQQPTAFNTRYTGNFGGPPGILAPYDNKRGK